MMGMAEGVGRDGMVVFHTRDITWSHQDSEEVWSGHLCTLHQTLAGGGAPPGQGVEVEEGGEGEGGQRQHRGEMLGGQALLQKFWQNVTETPKKKTVDELNNLKEKNSFLKTRIQSMEALVDEKNQEISNLKELETAV